MNYFFIAIIIPVFIIYVNHICFHLRFDPLLCATFLLSLLHLNLLPQLLILPLHPYTYMDHKMLL